ncbi:MAG: hypothetical protein L7H07_02855 [Candidatus Nanopusillus sp.]|nr:hypothetical protein [Candidatus Nanopusillus sp.]
MLLNKVDRVVRTNLNVLIRETEKEFLCDKPYEIEIDGIDLEENNYLVTDTGVYIDDKMYTTFSYHKLYTKISGEEVNNLPLKIMCGNKKRVIGYENIHKYLHLPDVLTTHLLSLFDNGVIAVDSKNIIYFNNGKASIYRHNAKVSTPYYLYKHSFNYTDDADLLAKIVGVTDVYKRNLFNRPGNGKYFYFLYPYVSLVLYKRLRTTLYPSYVSLIVSDAIELLKPHVDEELREFESNTLQNLKTLINDYNSKKRIIVTP